MYKKMGPLLYEYFQATLANSVDSDMHGSSAWVLPGSFWPLSFALFKHTIKTARYTDGTLHVVFLLLAPICKRNAPHLSPKMSTIDLTQSTYTDQCFYIHDPGPRDTFFSP